MPGTTKQSDGQRMVRSVVLTDYGGYENIKVQLWPLVTKLGSNDVEVAVDACGMNFADLYTRQGLMRDRQTPFVLGLECAGLVTAVGEHVTNVKVGNRVLCYQHTGGLYRETVILPEGNCFPLPYKMSYEDAAALAANYLTAYFCLIDIGNLRPGQKILIHSCAGGVGWAATQLAHSVSSDITIVGTASLSKHEAARKNGVSHLLLPVDYEQQLLLLSPEGVDIIIDNVAGPNFTISQNLLKPLGRVILIGSNSIISGDQKLSWWKLLRVWWSTKNVNPTDLIMKNRVVAGLHIGALMECDPARVHSVMNHLFNLYQEGKIQPHIDSVWPLEKVVEATKILAERRNVGKVILKITPTEIQDET